MSGERLAVLDGILAARRNCLVGASKSTISTLESSGLDGQPI